MRSQEEKEQAFGEVIHNQVLHLLSIRDRKRIINEFEWLNNLIKLGNRAQLLIIQPFDPQMFEGCADILSNTHPGDARRMLVDALIKQGAPQEVFFPSQHFWRP